MGGGSDDGARVAAVGTSEPGENSGGGGGGSSGGADEVCMLMEYAEEGALGLLASSGGRWLCSRRYCLLMALKYAHVLFSHNCVFFSGCTKAQ